jgi:KaiC/GvpD/RAD55 family RecA-like ATPase
MPKSPGSEPILGIPEVDGQLAGSLPRGWLGLLAGAPGSGIELLAKQFAGSAPARTTVLYYTTSERTDDILTAMRDFGWKEDIRVVNLSDEYYDKVLSRELDVSRYREKGISTQEIAEFQLEKPSTPQVNFVTRMTYDLAGFDQPFRLVVDSLDFFLEIGSPASVLSLVRQMRYRAQRVGGVALLTLNPTVHEQKVTGILEDICDLLLEMEVQAGGKAFQRSIHIRKVRNHPERTGVVPVTITSRGFGAGG